MTVGPGLRERKKRRTRDTLQREAMRLFAEHGYDETTVEQIAAAAEVSVSTFFRYFPTKEDVVLTDSFDPMIAQQFVARPAGEPPADAFRQSMRELLAVIPAAELDLALARARLSMRVPALRARTLDNQLGTAGMLADAVAARTGRPADDYRVRVAAFVLAGALTVAVLRWAETDGAEPLPELIDSALGLIRLDL